MDQCGHLAKLKNKRQFLIWKKLNPRLFYLNLQDIGIGITVLQFLSKTQNIVRYVMQNINRIVQLEQKDIGFGKEMKDHMFSRNQ